MSYHYNFLPRRGFKTCHHCSILNNNNNNNNNVIINNNNNDHINNNRLRGESQFCVFRQFLGLCVSSLRRGHADILCTVQSLTDDPRRESTSLEGLYFQQEGDLRREPDPRVQSRKQLIGALVVKPSNSEFLHLSLYMYVYIYIYIYISLSLYIYIERERDIYIYGMCIKSIG